MIQWIITIAIVLAAFTYAIVKIYRRFATKKQSPDQESCANCSSECASCELAETLKNNRKEILREASDQK